MSAHLYSTPSLSKKISPPRLAPSRLHYTMRPSACLAAAAIPRACPIVRSAAPLRLVAMAIPCRACPHSRRVMPHSASSITAIRSSCHHHPGATRRRSPPAEGTMTGRRHHRLELPAAAAVAVGDVVFQVFRTYDLNVSSGCCICCNEYIHMLRAYVLSVLGVSDVCFKCFSSGCCIYMHVASKYFKCFR
jgi:hypothetical protein